MKKLIKKLISWGGGGGFFGTPDGGKQKIKCWNFGMQKKKKRTTQKRTR